MRIPVFDLKRTKSAAKYLVRVAENARLSEVHEALARALGYRDWHELQRSRAVPSRPLPSLTVEAAAQASCTLAEALSIPINEAQYVLSRAGLFGTDPLTLTEQLAICTSAWRRRYADASGRKQPGKVIRDKATGRPAYLLVPGRPTFILSDSGVGTRADFEVTTPRVPLADFVPAAFWLPYGRWRLSDGSEVLFSRNYFPLWHLAGGRVERLDPWLWIHSIVDTRHFMTEAGASSWLLGASRDEAIAFLQTHEIAELPKLVGVLPYLFGTDCPSVPRAVERYYEDFGRQSELPPNTSLNGFVLQSEPA